MSAMDDYTKNFEIIFVNDGSTDRSRDVFIEATEGLPNAILVDLARNSGQTAALAAGIDIAQGAVIVTIDADLQNDPADIPALVDALEDGYDLVSGQRVDRQDSAFRRKFLSRMANRLISRLSGVRLNDYGCTLKAYRASTLAQVRLYGEMHRFIPIYVSWHGGKIKEMPVRHHARIHGVSKYGLERTAKVILDILVVMFLDRYFTKPIYVFGGFGLAAITISLFSFAIMLWLKFVSGVAFILTPLPLIAVSSFLCGVIGILLGLIAELLVRTYFEAQDKRPYVVRGVFRGGAPDAS